MKLKALLSTLLIFVLFSGTVLAGVEDLKKYPGDDWMLTVPGYYENSLKGMSGKGVGVAVIDSGVDVNHPMLRIKGAANCFKNPCVGGLDQVEDKYGHGTHVSGIIAGQWNNDYFNGVSPNVNLYFIKTSKDGIFDIGSNNPVDAVARALDWITAKNEDDDPNNDIDIVNMSLGFSPEYISDTEILDLEIAIAKVKASKPDGVNIVATAGNRGLEDSDEMVGYPALFNNVISVGNVDWVREETEEQAIIPEANLIRRMDSSYGKVDIAAFGSNVTSAKPGGGFIGLSGTSQAAPKVAGLLALYKEKYPNHNADQLQQVLYDNALDIGEKGFDIEFGHGLIQGTTELLQGVLNSNPYQLMPYGVDNSDSLVDNDQSTTATFQPGGLAAFVFDSPVSHVNQALVATNTELYNKGLTIQLMGDNDSMFNARMGWNPFEDTTNVTGVVIMNQGSEPIDVNEFELKYIVADELPIIPATTMYGFEMVDAPKAHELGLKGNGSTIALLGTGVDYSDNLPAPGGADCVKTVASSTIHGGTICDMARNDFNNKPIIKDTGKFTGDTNKYTTFQASVIASKPDLVQAFPGGVAPNATLFPVKVYKDGKPDAKAVIRAIDLSMSRLISIVVLPSELTEEDMAIKEHSYFLNKSVTIEDIINEAYKRGILFFAGSGDVGKDHKKNDLNQAAEIEKVIAVSAIDNQYQKGVFGNDLITAMGPKVELSAPGVEIMQRGSQGLDHVSGTDIAAAYAAGVAAITRQEYPKNTNESGTQYNERIRQQMRTNAKKREGGFVRPFEDIGYGNFLYGAGVVNTGHSYE